jgi:hypothetical protein
MPSWPILKLESSIWALQVSCIARPAGSISRHPLSAHFHHVRISKCQNHVVQPQFSLHPIFGNLPKASLNAAQWFGRFREDCVAKLGCFLQLVGI